MQHTSACFDFFKADSECERDSWIAAVTRCLQALRGPKVCWSM